MTDAPMQFQPELPVEFPPELGKVDVMVRFTLNEYSDILQCVTERRTTVQKLIHEVVMEDLHR